MVKVSSDQLTYERSLNSSLNDLKDGVPHQPHEIK